MPRLLGRTSEARAACRRVRRMRRTDRVHQRNREALKSNPSIVAARGGHVYIPAVRDGTVDVEVGEPVRLQPVGERRAPRDRARPGARSRSDRPVAVDRVRVLAGERHPGAARADRRALSRRHAGQRPRDGRLHRGPISSRYRPCWSRATRWRSWLRITCKSGARRRTWGCRSGPSTCRPTMAGHSTSSR